MPRPVLFTIDDDPEVLRAVERDLRNRYGERMRILRADSGQTALTALKQLKLRNEAVALLLVDQRMPQMSGTEFLEQAVQIYPDAKRVLLTAYADSEAAIQAINSAKVHYYLVKPWDPPEQHLYPVLDDLLEDWWAAYRPPFEGVRVVGHRWSAKSHAIKDFLARYAVPYKWLDVEQSDEARRLVEYAQAEPAQLPLVLYTDGTRMAGPSTSQIAEKIGLRTRAERPFYDLVIVGAGPAGLAAAVYGASEGLKTLLVDREAPGGQAGTSAKIENYLGFPEGLSGGDLARRAVNQARRFGVEIVAPQEVTSLRLADPYRYAKLGDGTEIGCHAAIIATGVSYRKLDVPGVERLSGAGIYYGAAMTEAASCRDEDVFVIGGANSAGQAAVYFSQYARRVTMIVRAPLLGQSMSQYLVDRIAQTQNIEVRTNTCLIEVHGGERLQRITLRQMVTGETETLPATSLFIMIGARPHTNWLAGLVERDEQGFVMSGMDLARDGRRPKGWNLDRAPYLLETSVPGVFVAGDVRHGSVKRVASGVGEGSIAIQFVHQYLANK
jgi:thioredoxin reductase (NADPH)